MAKKKPYEHEQIYAGIPFMEPKGVMFKLACCHCGLVHEVKIEDVPPSLARDSVYLTMRENASYTKRYRKANDEDLVCGPKTKPPKRTTRSPRSPKS
jgi:hypothetical protein